MPARHSDARGFNLKVSTRSGQEVVASSALVVSLTACVTTQKYRSGSVNPSPSGEKTLSKVAPQPATMAAQSNEIDVAGNTDDVPIGPGLAERYPTNWVLAGAREVVVRYLQENGVDPSKLRAISAGQYHPIDPNSSASNRERNRRTDPLLRPQASPGAGPQ